MTSALAMASARYRAAHAEEMPRGCLETDRDVGRSRAATTPEGASYQRSPRVGAGVTAVQGPCERLERPMVGQPVPSGIAIWVCRGISQDVCPWNERFASALPDESPFAPRQALAGRDARPVAREILTMSQAARSRAFSKSPMQRAERRGLKRNAAVVLGKVGTADVDVLTRALSDEAPLVREHAAGALARLTER